MLLEPWAFDRRQSTNLGIGIALRRKAVRRKESMVAVKGAGRCIVPSQKEAKGKGWND